MEQRKLSSRNFYANERKKCKSGAWPPLLLPVLVNRDKTERRGRRGGGAKEDREREIQSSRPFAKVSMPAGLHDVYTDRRASRAVFHSLTEPDCLRRRFHRRLPLISLSRNFFSAPSDTFVLHVLTRSLPGTTVPIDLENISRYTGHRSITMNADKKYRSVARAARAEEAIKRRGRDRIEM